MFLNASLYFLVESRSQNAEGSFYSGLWRLFRPHRALLMAFEMGSSGRVALDRRLIGPEAYGGSIRIHVSQYLHISAASGTAGHLIFHVSLDLHHCAACSAAGHLILHVFQDIHSCSPCSLPVLPILQGGYRIPRASRCTHKNS